ncbi:MAG: HAMP domain-containing histidine kinase [bacterium]|nr:HAMP domain-containing histidine kinase [bacterium]
MAYSDKLDTSKVTSITSIVAIVILLASAPFVFNLYGYSMGDSLVVKYGIEIGIVLALMFLVMGIVQKYVSVKNDNGTSKDVDALQDEINKLQSALEIQTNQLKQKNTELTQNTSQLNTTQLKLIESEKRSVIGTFTAGVAHEINNPINYIRGGIFSLKSNLEDILDLLTGFEKELTDAIDKLPRESAQRAVIIDALNNLSRRKMDLDYELLLEETSSIFHSVDEGVRKTAEITNSLHTIGSLASDEFVFSQITEHIDATLILLKKHLKDVEVVKFYQTVPTIEYMPTKISQVFFSLIKNAAESMVGEKKIVITCSPVTGNEFIRITISDYGRGIPEDVEPKVFDPFFTTKPVGEGFGLGLAIAKSIIEDHKGKLYFKSVVHHGTTFYIELPIQQSFVSQS